LVIQGEKKEHSNRLFDFSRLSENILIYKPNKKTHIVIPFKIGYNQKKEIEYLLRNISQIPIQVTLKKNQICLTYEQEKEIPHSQISGITLGIDNNPNYIGVNISRNGVDIYNTVFSWSNKARKNDNKRKHETIQIAHRIIALAVHFHVSLVALEDLTMGARDAGLGKNFNRLCNNEWDRNEFTWQIKKLGDKNNIKVLEVNCAYSSTIGNVMYRHLPDPCAAGKEIARRGQNKFVKSLCMYPEVDFTNLPVLTQWKELHNVLKNSKIKYRVPLEGISSDVFRFSSVRSGILEHVIAPYSL
jgi:hypothetical protein